jgi:ribose-phosphate pyrophosphokinase
MIDTGKTLSMATRTLKDNGASTVYVLVSHGSHLVFLSSWTNLFPVPGLFSEMKMSLVQELPIEQLVV